MYKHALPLGLKHIKNIPAPSCWHFYFWHKPIPAFKVCNTSLEQSPSTSSALINVISCTPPQHIRSIWHTPVSSNPGLCSSLSSTCTLLFTASSYSPFMPGLWAVPRAKRTDTVLQQTWDLRPVHTDLLRCILLSDIRLEILLPSCLFCLLVSPAATSNNLGFLAVILGFYFWLKS